MHVAVLPRAKPEQHHMQIVLASSANQLVHDAKVEAACLSLDLLPIDGSFDGVGMQGCHRFPYLRQLRRPGAGVVDLPSKNQIRFAFNEKRPPAVLLDQARSLCGKSVRHRDAGEEQETHREQQSQANWSRQRLCRFVHKWPDMISPGKRPATVLKSPKWERRNYASRDNRPGIEGRPS